VIAIGLYVVIQLFMTNKPPSAQPSQTLVISPYAISIYTASWGLNCREFTKNGADTEYNTTNNADIDKLRENNVLYQLSKICNGKPSCNIAVSPTMLGEDPMPSCGYKELQIEYRCFSVDRLRKIKTDESSVIIDCDKQLGTQ